MVSTSLNLYRLHGGRAKASCLLGTNKRLSLLPLVYRRLTLGDSLALELESAHRVLSDPGARVTVKKQRAEGEHGRLVSQVRSTLQ